MPFTNRNAYSIPPPGTTASSIDSQQADTQSEPNPACWGAVCADANWSLLSLSPTPTATSQKKTRKLRTERSNESLLTRPDPTRPDP